MILHKFKFYYLLRAVGKGLEVQGATVDGRCFTLAWWWLGAGGGWGGTRLKIVSILHTHFI